MKRFIGFAAALVLACPLAAAAQDKSPEALINDALQAAPESLRAGATVIEYDAQGNKKVLREGTNSIVCEPTDKDGFVRCYHKVMAPRNDFQAKLRAQGKSAKEIQEATTAATKDGTLKVIPYGTMMYRYTNDPKRIQRLWVMLVPGATPESTGLSTASQRDAALKGEGQPWLMLPGTPGAHVMIPINAKEPTSTK